MKITIRLAHPGIHGRLGVMTLPWINSAAGLVSGRAKNSSRVRGWVAMVMGQERSKSAELADRLLLAYADVAKIINL
jgi:hypothetical protein